MPPPNTARRKPAALTTEELLALPPTVDIPTAARALGIGRNVAYDLAQRDEFPVPVLRLGVKWRVPTSGLLEVLGVQRPDTAAAS